ncbi:semialdehyde dehydrogenase [Chitinophaga parva]|uniref:Semialdehyde dehydrogenase n=1 Tax=Chitinophaga parva TaxID=2169414 RepID=A0A2T7BPE8_9BACT|nr:NAD(P)H-binding protein [Chitinophaga parva]PUZ29546.1 semialdehyde dehydrogenase [Chitinophaga parva]
MPFTAIVLGGSGLTGHQLLLQLCDTAACTHVRALVRKPLGPQHPKLETVVVDFNNDAAFRQAIQGDVIFCCIGTTMAKAKTQAVYRSIDFDIPVKAARFGVANGVHQYLLISSIGAGIGRASFYQRLKGEVERAVQDAGLASVQVFRPSLIMGQRGERRVMEKIFQAVWPVVSLFFWGRARKYRGIKASTIARAMVRVAQKAAPGIHVYESDAIEKLGKA